MGFGSPIRYAYVMISANETLQNYKFDKFAALPQN